MRNPDQSESMLRMHRGELMTLNSVRARRMISPKSQVRTETLKWTTRE
jgi:hypothetical protein